MIRQLFSAAMLALVPGCVIQECHPGDSTTQVCGGGTGDAPDAAPPAPHLTCGGAVPLCPAFAEGCDTAADCCLQNPSKPCDVFQCLPCCVSGTSDTINICVD